ncbi:MAG: PqqD family protein [Mangrovibacterium sp.]
MMKIPKEVKISDNGFVFNSQTGDSFNLNPTGLELIKMISEEKSIEEIKDAIIANYDVDDLTFEKDFYEFCTLLKHHQITIQGAPLEFN